jgi:hypothetical protein
MIVKFSCFCVIIFNKKYIVTYTYLKNSNIDPSSLNISSHPNWPKSFAENVEENVFVTQGILIMIKILPLDK